MVVSNNNNGIIIRIDSVNVSSSNNNIIKRLSDAEDEDDSVRAFWSESAS